VLTGSGSVEELLGAELAAAVAKVRTTVTAELRSILAGRIRGAQPGLRVTVHGSPDPWATGSFATLAPNPGDGVDAAVTNCFEAGRSAEAVAALRALLDGAGQQGMPSIGGIVRPTGEWADEAVLRDRLARMQEAGMEELHLYHLGLVGSLGLRMLERTVSAFVDGRA
jgi:hypothetical protein